MQDIITEIRDMRYLKWTRLRHSSGTAGSYLKAYEIIDGRKVYYKLSCFDSVNGITGNECAFEVVSDRLLTLLGIEHLHYQLQHAMVLIDGKEYDTWICASSDYKQPGDSKIALDDYYDLKRRLDESPLEFCIRMGWEKFIYEMLVVDFLILNRDRHGANIEIIMNRKNSTVRPAPLFDHGTSLLFSLHTKDEIMAADLMEDKPVQCFVGSHSASENLKLIPGDRKPELRRLEERDKAVIMKDMDKVIPDYLIDRVWDMIWKRWQYYENM